LQTIDTTARHIYCTADETAGAICNVYQLTHCTGKKMLSKLRTNSDNTEKLCTKDIVLAHTPTIQCSITQACSYVNQGFM